MAKTTKQLATKLKAMGVKVCGTAREFYGRDVDGVWVSLEEGLLAKFGYCCCTDAFFESDVYVVLDQAGFYLEAYDPGTGIIYKSFDGDKK
jgi:hypothetical protein